MSRYDDYKERNGVRDQREEKPSMSSEKRTTEPKTEYGKIAKSKYVKVRIGPSETSRVAAILDDSDRFEIVGQESGYFSIKLRRRQSTNIPNGPLYIRSEYCEKI